jgi:hypothetical protein
VELAIHLFRHRTYERTDPGKRFVRLEDGSYGASRRGGKRTFQEPELPFGVIHSTKAPFDVHCPTARCGGQRVTLAVPIAEG